MVRRIFIISVLIAGAGPLALAQQPKSPSPSSAAQRPPKQNVRVVLKMQSLLLYGNFGERANITLPKVGANAVLGAKDSALLPTMAAADHRSMVSNEQQLTLKSGQKPEHSPPNATGGNNAILATVADDRQSIEIHVPWPEQHDGKKKQPATTAVVPVGSSLLVHIEDTVLEQEVKVTNPLLHIKDRFLGTKSNLVKRDFEVFLLLSPHVVVDGEKEDRPAAK